MPWEGGAPSYGFGPSPDSWLPQPEAYGELAVDRQVGVEGSTLELYRTLLRLRREHGLGRGELTWVDLGEDLLAFDITTESGTSVRVIANTGREFAQLPPGSEVLVASEDVDIGEGFAGRLRGVAAGRLTRSACCCLRPDPPGTSFNY